MSENRRRTLGGKTAIVMGGGKGIGRATSIALADAGASVGICARTDSDIQLVAEQIVKSGGNAIPIETDITEQSQIEKAFFTMKRMFNHIDILVNSASIAKLGSVEEISLKDWNSILKTNLTGTFLCCKHVVKHMSKPGGRIVNISSTAGISGGVDQTPYHVSKAGVIMLTKCLAMELASYGITVNSIAPGYVETPNRGNRESQKLVEETIPLGRFGQPEEIGRLVTFLVSDECGYISGHTIVIDGGLTTGIRSSVGFHRGSGSHRDVYH